MVESSATERFAHSSERFEKHVGLVIAIDMASFMLLEWYASGYRRGAQCAYAQCTHVTLDPFPDFISRMEEVNKPSVLIIHGNSI